MMPPEPLRSATTSECVVEDTSLALPNDKKLRSGQQRVLDQVHTIKRSKSKQGRNGSTSPSPTTLVPHSISTYTEFGSFKFNPGKSNGYFSRSGSSAYSKSTNSQKSRTLSLKATGGRHVNASGAWEQQINNASRFQGANGLTSSRSDPSLAPFTPAHASAAIMRSKRGTVQSQNVFQSVNRQSTYSMTDGNMQQTSIQTRARPTSTVSNNDAKMGAMFPSASSKIEGKMGTIKTSKIEQKSAVNSSASVSDMTLTEAVDYLSSPEENLQQYGATFIQNATYKDESTKSEVFQLEGIAPLVILLGSPNKSVSESAAGALRNLVFKNQRNKLEVQHCGGIAKALQLLKQTDSTETQKQITGLLWNLSSADELKDELISTALPALTENVVVPFTCWSESVNNNHIDPDVFFCATGCLRNLSSGDRNERQAMRRCPGLIDSLMTYIESCVDEENPDDKSVENCVCILHNLTYQLENECPTSFSDILPQNDAPAENTNPVVGCFSPKSSKAQKEFSYGATREMPKIGVPSGEKWLCHPKAMKMYLSLLDSSMKDATVEACCGALQNLTAGNDLGSSAVSQMLVHSFEAPVQMSSLLKSSNPALQKTAISLVGNISRTNGLQKAMSKQIMPDLTSLLASGTGKMSDKTIACACNTIRKLLPGDPDVTKKVLTRDLIYSVIDISDNKTSPAASTAALALLHSLWDDRSVQGILKKLQMNKSVFVNKDTTNARFPQ